MSTHSWHGQRPLIGPRPADVPLPNLIAELKRERTYPATSSHWSLEGTRERDRGLAVGLTTPATPAPRPAATPPAESTAPLASCPKSALLSQVASFFAER